MISFLNCVRSGFTLHSLLCLLELLICSGATFSVGMHTWRRWRATSRIARVQSELTTNGIRNYEAQFTVSKIDLNSNIIRLPINHPHGD